MKYAYLLALPIISASLNFATSAAEQSAWEIQPDSTIKWKISNLGMATNGTFSKISGEVVYDGPAKLTAAQVTAKIPIDSINSDNSLRDGHLKSKDFFNVKQFPLAEFRSSEIKETKDGHFEILGTLSLHGVNQPVTLEADPLKETKDKDGKRHLSTTATGTVNRKTAGIGGFTAATIGADAKIEISVDLIKS